ncbi:MAG: HAD-IB family hydrolase, partial [Methanococcaceae archaeon]
ALFDFDGTITKKDSFLEFIKFYNGRRSFIYGLILLSPILLLYRVGLIQNWKAKEILLTYFFKKEPFKKFCSKSTEFSSNIIPDLIKPKALQTILEHLSNGHRVIIVSASFETWLSDWCKKMNLELIGSRIEVRDGLVTGKIEGKNCHGAEKVKRLNEYLDIKQYPEIYAYGDSSGDLPLLNLANHRFYRFF